MFNVIRYTEWPESSFVAGQPITVCRFGSDGALVHALSALEGRVIRGSEIRVRTVEADASGCLVLVFPEGGNVAAVRRMQGRPLLTVGEGWAFLDEGGVLAVVVADGRLAFGVNLDAARRGNLRLSAQLLRLARRVVEGAGK